MSPAGSHADAKHVEGGTIAPPFIRQCANWIEILPCGTWVRRGSLLGAV